MKTMNCDICGRNHATWEHKVFEKLRLAETGMPIERLFVTLDCSDMTTGETARAIDDLGKENQED